MDNKPDKTSPLSPTPTASAAGDGSSIHYCVDEAGDPVLFDAKGRVIIGNDGCSKYFIVGKLDITDCETISHTLSNLRVDLLADPYFAKVPSMQRATGKTAVNFHAKDDPPEVRYQVYKVLRELNVRFYAVVRNKTDLVSFVKQQNEREDTYRYRQDELYDTLVQELFKNRWYKASAFNVCFAKRGSKDRTDAFKNSLQLATKDFESGYGFKPDVKVDIECSTPAKNFGLQAVDYFLWALQRYYERGEDRYIQMLWNQVGEVHDLDRLEDKRRGVFFNKGKPLPDLEKP